MAFKSCSVILLLAFFINYSEQLQCYQCIEGQTNSETLKYSHDSLPCQDLNTDTNVVTCASNAEKCLKFDIELNDNKASVRVCGNVTSTPICENINNGPAAKSIAIKASIDCTSCTGDKCNSASSTVTSLLAVAISAYLIKLIS